MMPEHTPPINATTATNPAKAVDSAKAVNTARPGPAMASRWRNERGASEAFMLIWAVFLVWFAGLAFDAGMIFNARRQATNIAAAAARAGADQVSTDALYGEGLVRLDRDAEAVAYNSAMTAGVESADVRRSGDVELIVKVTDTYDPVILHLIGFDSIEVEAEVSAFVDRRVN